MEKKEKKSTNKRKILFGTINIYLYRFIILYFWIFYLFILESSFFLNNILIVFCFHWIWLPPHHLIAISTKKNSYFFIKFIKRQTTDHSYQSLYHMHLQNEAKKKVTKKREE